MLTLRLTLMASTVSLTKDRLAKKLRRNFGGQKQEADEMVDAMFDIMAGALLRGENVSLEDFGVFRLHTIDAREGHNFLTGERCEVPEKVRVTFTACAATQEKLNVQNQA